MTNALGLPIDTFEHNFKNFGYARIISEPNGVEQALHADYAIEEGVNSTVGWQQYFDKVKEVGLPPMGALWMPEGGKIKLVTSDVYTSER